MLLSYQPIERLISEYEHDSNIIKSDRLIMANYPKDLLLSAASLFEGVIKNSLTNFCASPKITVPTKITRINNRLKTEEVLSDKLFAKFIANPRTSTMDASRFYALFSGTNFKSDAENNFDIIRIQRLADVANFITGLTPMLGKGESFDFEYVKQDDLLNVLNTCTFDSSESSFLGLKLRRNKVAHDYISGLTDTFVDIRNFYYSAQLYVLALVTTLDAITI